VASIALLSGIAGVQRTPVRLPWSSLRTALVSGGLDMFANVLYLLAVRRGLLAVVSALTALYPASTVLLAQTVLAERMRKVQVAGLGVALVAAVLIAA
jgi:drug/metabolite transporter (DMT)-like permease